MTERSSSRKHSPRVEGLQRIPISQINKMARNRTSEQRSISAGRPFITNNELRRTFSRRTNAEKLLDRDAFMRSPLSPGQIYFMRFVGVQTERQWIIDDRYRNWSKAEYSLRANLRQRYTEGAQRIRITL